MKICLIVLRSIIMIPLGILWFSFIIAFSPVFIAMAFLLSDSREEALDCLRDVYVDTVVNWWESLFEL